MLGYDSTCSWRMSNPSHLLTVNDWHMPAPRQGPPDPQDVRCGQAADLLAPPPRGAQPVRQTVVQPGGRPFMWALLCVLHETLCSPVVAVICFSVFFWHTPLCFAWHGSCADSGSHPVSLLLGLCAALWPPCLPRPAQASGQKVLVFIKVPYRQLGDSSHLSDLGRSPHTQALSTLAAGGRPGTARYSWTHCSGLPELGCWSVQPPQEIPQCSPSATPAYSSHPPPPSSRITSVPAPLCHLPQLGPCSQEPLKRAAAGALWRAVSTSIPVWLGRAGPELLGALLAAAVLLLVHRDLSSFSSPFALGALWSTSPLSPGL